MKTDAGNRSMISEEKRIEYAQTKAENERRKRQARKSETEQGKTGERRLAFFEQIVRTQGYNWKKLAEASGLTAQAISWWVSVADDAKYSKIQEVLAAVGIMLTAKLERSLPQPAERGQYKIVGVLPPVNRNPTASSRYLIDCIENGGRLAFLAQYIMDNRHTFQEVCNLCGMEQTSLRSYFMHDDIKVSQIYRIAQCLDASVTWEVRPTGDVPGETTDIESK